MIYDICWYITECIQSIIWKPPLCFFVETSVSTTTCWTWGYLGYTSKFLEPSGSNVAKPRIYPQSRRKWMRCKSQMRVVDGIRALPSPILLRRILRPPKGLIGWFLFEFSTRKKLVNSPDRTEWNDIVYNHIQEVLQQMYHHKKEKTMGLNIELSKNMKTYWKPQSSMHDGIHWAIEPPIECGLWVTYWGISYNVPSPSSKMAYKPHSL